MEGYYFEEERFVIDNYLKKSTFSNFLPGLAGKKGIPLWAFYVNRGQGISGFGLQDKNHPIMEFTPANKAYESVGQIGFRTFMKVDGVYHEPFLPETSDTHRMLIDRHSFTIEETHTKRGVKTRVTYYGLPNENIGALVRHVEITNIHSRPIHLELLDGLAEILPAGINNQDFKAVSNLLCSWMDVEELDKGYAFYKLRSSTGDSAEVKTVSNGNYLLGLMNGELHKPIADQDMVFGFDNAKRKAEHFIATDMDTLLKESQVTANKIPCGFIPVQKTLAPGEILEIDLLAGHTHTLEILEAFLDKVKTPGYLKAKEAEAKQIIDDMVNDVATDTSSHIFNEYIKQNYLDNLLRGGYPYKIGHSIYHLFSRRHGDLERDYNFFSLAPEFYSQGSGNFRDVCQNRRMDSFIHPEVGAENIKHFASLIQLDGYNPLTVHGLTFSIPSANTRRRLIQTYFNNHQDEIFEFMSQRFSPGGLVNYLYNLGIDLDENIYLDDIINHSEKHVESAFGEGYWVDHFTYILDLAEAFEAIYPDKMHHVLFEENDIPTFDSPVTVLGKLDKSVITSDGKIRQYGSLLHFDEDKIERCNLNRYGSNWVLRDKDVYQTNLFTKLFILVLNKHAGLDNENLGVEMEAEKPGWNDAMNGVPGLFGSGISETIELKRIVRFLLEHLKDESLKLPAPVHELFVGLMSASSYEARVTLRENYRESVRFGLFGSDVATAPVHVRQYLENLDRQIRETLENLYEENDRIIPTFVVYEVEKYHALTNNNKPVIGNYHLPLVHPITYKKRYLPKFLEAPARLLKTDFDQEKLKAMVKAIKESDIYDKKLSIYKTSEHLAEEDYEIGRIRAFTEGWLERESDFLHMIYKYLFGLLRAGLYEEFYTEIKTNFVCYMDPAVYGRNILENSSFIAPSNNPNPAIHGKGFLPRLSGSTVEVLDIWRWMMTGGTPFTMRDGKLVFKPEPKLHHSYFKADKTLSFTLLKHVQVTYVNETLKDTYSPEAKIGKIELSSSEGKEIFYQDSVEGNLAIKIREGLYKNIKIYIV